MEPQQAMDVLNAGLWTGFKVAAPLLLTSLIVGGGIGLIQALVQVQEAALAFVPKVFAVGLALAIFVGFMGKSLGSFMRYSASIIAGS